MIQFFPSLVGFRGFPPEFIITVKTDNAGVSASNQILLPILGTNMVIDWGDGNVSTHTQTATPNNTIGGNNVIHTYASAGVYTIKISNINYIRFAAGGDRLKLLEINNWGKSIWSSFGSSFWACTNLSIITKDAPNLSSVTNLGQTFLQSNITTLDTTNWDISNITSLFQCFQNTLLSKLNTINWDTSKVTNFGSTFNNCNSLNENFGHFFLNVNITSMSNMLNVSNSTIGTNFQEAYSRTLIGWANNIFSRGGVVTGKSLGANNRRYNNINYVSGQQFNNAVDARNYLVNTLGWTITGDAQV